MTIPNECIRILIRQHRARKQSLCFGDPAFRSQPLRLEDDLTCCPDQGRDSRGRWHCEWTGNTEVPGLALIRCTGTPLSASNPLRKQPPDMCPKTEVIVKSAEQERLVTIQLCFEFQHSSKLGSGIGEAIRRDALKQYRYLPHRASGIRRAFEGYVVLFLCS